MKTEYHKKLIHYATAKRCTAGKITQYIDGDFVTFWAGRVRGIFVKSSDKYKFKTKAEAIQFAREWRDSCISEAVELGLIDQPIQTGDRDEKEKVRSSSAKAS